jgi:phage shock protein A
MNDPFESVLEAMAAMDNLIGRLDEQLAAAREANARLTAELVRLELQSAGLLAKVDQLEARLARWQP